MPSAKKIIGGKATNSHKKGTGIYKIQIRTEQHYSILSKSEYKKKLPENFLKLEKQSPNIRAWKDWTVRVSFCKRSSSSENAEFEPKKLITGVRFLLHPDFGFEEGITIKDPPYEINNVGFGSFEVSIDIFPRRKGVFPKESVFYTDVSKRSKTIYHMLDLDAGHREWKTSRHEIEFVNPGSDFHNALEESGIDFLIKNLGDDDNEVEENSLGIKKSKKSKKDKKSSNGMTENYSQDSNFEPSPRKKEKKAKKNRTLIGESKKRKSEIPAIPNSENFKKAKTNLSQTLPINSTSPGSINSIISPTMTDTTSISTTTANTSDGPIKLKLKFNNLQGKTWTSSHPGSPNMVEKKINLQENTTIPPSSILNQTAENFAPSAFKRVDSNQSLINENQKNNHTAAAISETADSNQILKELAMSDEVTTEDELTNLDLNNDSSNIITPSSDTNLIMTSKYSGSEISNSNQRTSSADLPAFESPIESYQGISSQQPIFYQGNTNQMVSQQLSTNSMNNFLQNVHQLTRNNGLQQNVQRDSNRTSLSSHLTTNPSNFSAFQPLANSFSANTSTSSGFQSNPTNIKNSTAKTSNLPIDTTADKIRRKKQREKEKKARYNTQWNNFDLKYKEIMIEKILENFTTRLENNPEDPIITKVSNILYPIEYAVDIAYRSESANSSAEDIIARSSSQQINDQQESSSSNLNLAEINNNSIKNRNSNRNSNLNSETNSEITSNISSIGEELSNNSTAWDPEAKQQEMKVLADIEALVSEHDQECGQMGFNLSDLKGYEIFRLCRVLEIEFGIV